MTQLFNVKVFLQGVPDNGVAQITYVTTLRNVTAKEAWDQAKAVDPHPMLEFEEVK